MKEFYTRKMTFNERAFVVLHCLCPFMQNKSASEGERVDISKKDLKKG